MIPVSSDWPPPAEPDPEAFEDVNQGRLTSGESGWLIAGSIFGAGGGAMLMSLLYNLPA